jgi:hypothetical protein
VVKMATISPFSEALERQDLSHLEGGKGFVTSQDVRLQINRKPKCALYSCIENLGNFRAFK